MTGATELGAFLRSRRERLRPQQAGVADAPGRRQVPGLRREEIAVLAGVSVEYYTRLEQGRDHNPGTAVLEALARALLLDDVEVTHLRTLARREPPGVGSHRSVARDVRPSLRSMAEALRPVPVWIIDGWGNLLDTSPEGAELLPGIQTWPRELRNVTRYLFTHPEARRVMVSWPEIAQACVADLRTASVSSSTATTPCSLADELSAVSQDFVRLWARHDVGASRGGPRIYRHPVVGQIETTTEILTSIDGLRVVVHLPARDVDRETFERLSRSSPKAHSRTGG